MSGLEDLECMRVNMNKRMSMFPIEEDAAMEADPEYRRLSAAYSLACNEYVRQAINAKETLSS